MVRKAKKAVRKRAKRGGRKFACSQCGLVISVDETCGCVEARDIVCCGQRMRAKR